MPCKKWMSTVHGIHLKLPVEPRFNSEELSLLLKFNRLKEFEFLLSRLPRSQAELKGVYGRILIFFVQSMRDKYLLSVLLKLFLRIELPSSVNKVRCSMVLCLPLSCASIELTLTSGQMLSLTSLSGSLSSSMITNL